MSIVYSFGCVCVCVCVCVCSAVSVMSDLHGLQPTRLLCPWDFPSNNTEVGCHVLHQGIFMTQGLNPHLMCLLGFPGGSDSKASACNVGDPGSIPGSRRSPGEGNGNPLYYCCLENPMDRETW